MTEHPLPLHNWLDGDDEQIAAIGQKIYALCETLFPICRSITGDGVRETLRRIAEHIPQLSIYEVPSGTRCFDWTVPPEWNIRDAYIIGPDGDKIVDFQASNLHVVSYSLPVDREIGLEELQSHLHSIPELPDAIPYVTSYYNPQWGFCITQNQRNKLRQGTYRVKIESTLAPGNLTYGEMILPGEMDREIFLSTYICHPSLANNELSGPAVTTFLAKQLAQLRRKYTYRFIFIPETIGSITYLSRHLDHLKSAVIGGFNITCVGDERCYSYLPSRRGDTLSDKVAKHVLSHIDKDYIAYSFLDRGSDERQYCAPFVDLPIASVMRSKYGRYPEYHTSLDNLSLITPAGLAGAYRALSHCLLAMENCATYRTEVLCEPQMGRRGLYSTLGTRNTEEAVRIRMDLLAYCDGENDLVDIANIIGVPIWDLIPYARELQSHQLISELGVG